MALRLIVVGKDSRDPLIDAAEDYLRRARRHVPIDTRLVAPHRRGKDHGDAQVKRREAQLIERAAAGARLVLLDAGGAQLSSEGFAKKLQGWLAGGDVALAIGGATGLDPDLLARHPDHLSLGKMTFAHRLVRVLLSEQIYRAMAIVHNEPYHK